MKFKKVKGTKCTKEIKISDSEGDALIIQTHWAGKPELYFQTNNAVGVFVKRDKALKLAWAIIDHFDPSVLA